MTKDTYNINDLKNVMKKLLSEKGCPWDKAQNHESLKKYLIEECYEAIEAINNNDMDNLCEELGDILFQVMFHSELAEKEGCFNFDNVVNNVTKKMIYRHPHVFTENKTNDCKLIENNWEELKKREKGYTSPKDIMDSIPKALPSLIRSQKAVSKAIKQNLDEGNAHISVNKILGYANKLLDHDNLHKKELEENIGNFILELTKFSYFLQINADFSLTNALETYINKVEDK